MYKKFFKKLIVKCVRRAAGVALAMIPASVVITQVDWRAIWLSAATAVVMTIFEDFSKFPMEKRQKVTKSNKKSDKK